MSSTLPLFSLSSSDDLANELTDDKISKYLTHWLTSPTLYVHQLSGIKGIKRLCGGIEELCTRSKPIITRITRVRDSKCTAHSPIKAVFFKNCIECKDQ